MKKIHSEHPLSCVMCSIKSFVLYDLVGAFGHFKGIITDVHPKMLVCLNVSRLEVGGETVQSVSHKNAYYL